MDSRAAIKSGLDMAEFVCMAYLADMSDENLMLRPHPECNHLNWQVGHLILAEHEMMAKVIPSGMPALPSGFAEKYGKEAAKGNDRSQFCSRDELMQVYKVQRAATQSALATTSDSQFDAPTGVDYAPTVGAMFALQASHWLMHCGQWVIVRRSLGKPVVI